MLREPVAIEEKSFTIIDSEIDIRVPKELQFLLYRMIHTTADFEYAKITEIHPLALRAYMDALRSGATIYADTAMICSGVNGNRLAQYGSRIYTLVKDPSVVKEAAERGVTRSIVALEHAALDPATKIFVIGNAPTALVTLCDLIRAGKVRPSVVIGVPVGFVGAAESKDELASLDVPYIITRGRKGGSTIAAAVCNAILIEMGKQ